MKEIKYSPDGVVAFRESDHVYYVVETGEILESTSRQIAKHHAPFNPGNYVKARTRKLWAESGQLGTLIHHYAENRIMTDNLAIPNPDATWEPETIENYWLKVEAVEEWLDNNMHRIEKAECEIIGYDLEAGIAGQIDLFCLFDGKPTILDWKSNKIMKDKGIEEAMMLEPFEDMPDCNLSKYSLQQNVYREFIYPMAKMNLIWIDLYQCHLIPIDFIDVRNTCLFWPK